MPLFNNLPLLQKCVHLIAQRVKRERIFSPGDPRGPFGKAARGSTFSPGYSRSSFGFLPNLRTEESELTFGTSVGQKYSQLTQCSNI